MLLNYMFVICYVGVCQLKGSTVVTLDQKEYQSPDTQGCDAVLVMDCSSASKFAVKVKSKPSDQSKKVNKYQCKMPLKVL